MDLIDQTPRWRIRTYEFLAAPAHAWLLLCALVVGIPIKFGPIDAMRFARGKRTTRG